MNEFNTIDTRDSINVKLTQAEVHERAMQSVRVAAEYDQAESEFKAVTKDWKKRLEAVDSRLLSLRRTVESGEEYREVDCQRAYDVANGKTWLVYEGKKYLERPCTSDELELVRQGSLFEGVEHGEG